MTQPNKPPEDNLPSNDHHDAEPRLSCGGLSSSGSYKEHVSTPEEIEIGQDIVVALGNLTSGTLLRSGVALDAPVSSMTFQSEKLQGHRLTLNVTFISGMYSTLLTGYETGTNNGKTQYANLSVRSDGNRILEFERADFNAQADSLLNGLPYFEGSAAEIKIKVPQVEDESQQ